MRRKLHLLHSSTLTQLWPFSKSKFNLKSGRVNLVSPASPFECLLYLPTRPTSGRYSTKWERKGWPGSEIQMYYDCPCPVPHYWYKRFLYSFLSSLKPVFILFNKAKLDLITRRKLFPIPSWKRKEHQNIQLISRLKFVAQILYYYCYL